MMDFAGMMDFVSYQQALWIFLAPVLLFLLGLRIVYAIFSSWGKVFADVGNWLRNHNIW